jgi:4-hydroxythreonine-4-phosphate dehydrogenase
MTSAPLVITPGEPGGVGAEITLKAWLAKTCPPFALIADADHVDRLSQIAGLNCPIARIGSLSETEATFANALPVLHRALPHLVEPGHFKAQTASWVMDCIEEAVDICLAGRAAAMVTNPIQKEALYAAGFKYQGHTDFLAALCHARGLPARDVMMLVGGGLRTVPLTVHIALKDVPTQLTMEAIVAQGEVVDQALRTHFNVVAPRLAVTGLNPHAGENGNMGQEEIDVILSAGKGQL